MNQLELEAFRTQENKLIFKNVYNDNYFYNKPKTKMTTINIIKKRNISLRRDIRRNSPFIIKKSEIKSNPLLFYICIISNRELMNSKFLLIIIAFIVYTQQYLVEKTIVIFTNSDKIYLFIILGVVISLSNLKK
jgi:hypothetical protein